MTILTIHTDSTYKWSDLTAGSPASAKGAFTIFSSSGFDTVANPFDQVFSAVDHSGDKQSYLREFLAARAARASRAPRGNRSTVRDRYQGSTAVHLGLPLAPELATADTSATPDGEDAPSEATTTLLAEWEGYVTRIDTKTFEANLSGVFGEGVEGEVDEATIPFDEIRDADRDLLDIGALFRLCVTYEKSERGQVRRFTELVFRRMPIYMLGDIKAAKLEAERLSGINVE